MPAAGLPPPGGTRTEPHAVPLVGATPEGRRGHADRNVKGKLPVPPAATAAGGIRTHGHRLRRQRTERLAHGRRREPESSPGCSAVMCTHRGRSHDNRSASNCSHTHTPDTAIRRAGGACGRGRLHDHSAVRRGRRDRVHRDRRPPRRPACRRPGTSRPLRPWGCQGRQRHRGHGGDNARLMAGTLSGDEENCGRRGAVSALHASRSLPGSRRMASLP